MVLTEIEAPWTGIKGAGLWMLYCTGKDKLFVHKDKEGKYHVTGCVDENRECIRCIGCHPRAVLSFDPNKITNFKELVHAMQVNPEELQGNFMTMEAIKKRLEPYEQSKEQWFWFRTIDSSDLDAVYVFQVKEVS